MQYILLLIVLVALFFFVSKYTIKIISQFLFHLTKKRRFTVYFLALLFFPGTFIHELAHATIAAVLLVPIGDIHLWPKIEEDQVKLGSVQIAKTDFIRRFFIGVAPLLFGLAMLYGVVFFLQAITNSSWLFYAGTSYLIFTVCNSMFSSKRDMEGALEFFILLIILIVAAVFVGFKPWQIVLPFSVLATLQLLDKLLLIPLGIDAIIIIILKLLHVLRKTF